MGRVGGGGGDGKKGRGGSGTGWGRPTGSSSGTYTCTEVNVHVKIHGITYSKCGVVTHTLSLHSSTLHSMLTRRSNLPSCNKCGVVTHTYVTHFYSSLHTKSKIQPTLLDRTSNPCTSVEP